MRTAKLDLLTEADVRRIVNEKLESLNLSDEKLGILADHVKNLETSLRGFACNAQGSPVPDSFQLKDIPFSCRVDNCLRNAGIFTAGQLRSKHEAELLKYRNFGPHSLRELKLVSASYGIVIGSGIS